MKAKTSAQVTVGKYVLSIAALGVVFCIALFSARHNPPSISARPLSATEMSAIVGDGWCVKHFTCYVGVKEGNDCVFCLKDGARILCCPHETKTCDYDGGNSDCIGGARMVGTPIEGSCTCTSSAPQIGGTCSVLQNASGQDCDS